MKFSTWDEAARHFASILKFNVSAGNVQGSVEAVRGHRTDIVIPRYNVSPWNKHASGIEGIAETIETMQKKLDEHEYLISKLLAEAENNPV